ncbi:allophanate hydrolase [Kibdelosporangium phytohabitans]|uniref:Allophanate hydrolase n=1 Tax=Kibdelosporangium phytohabitans TaxID=860235 RepID=A0A0N9IKH3_9PSEU|nr:allophanate hydrolase [Kibdelosporangium phytohabitans]
MLGTGPLALVQDLGRPGNAQLGVPPSGALDQPSLRLANRLVGNPESAAGIEALLGGVSLRAESSCTIAVTGPQVDVTVSGRLVGSHAPVHLARGDEVAIGTPVAGLRCYIGISGGVDGPLELGSRATDVLSGLGPDALQRWDVLLLGVPGLPVGADEVAPLRAADELVIPVFLGPRDDWFSEPGRELAAGQWQVSPESNRVGLRLAGTELRRQAGYQDVELASEGLVTGSIQVRPNGLPVVFLADHPTTGGYPVIGVVAAASLPSLAQARPGVRIRFRPMG